MPSEDRYRNNEPKDRLIPALPQPTGVLSIAGSATGTDYYYCGSQKSLSPHEQTEQEIGAIASTGKIQQVRYDQQHRGSAGGIP
jgi:hypothetical protein